MKILCFICLLLGFSLLFLRIRWLKRLAEFLKKTQAGMQEAARQRSLANRQNLLRIQKEHSLLFFLEKELNYTGLAIRFPFLSVEIWITGNVILGTAVFMGMLLFLKSMPAAAGAVSAVFLLEFFVFRFCRARTMKSVNGHLIKFLDFLGNYSVTAGEVTGIFNQISRYMEEPLKSVLDQCYYEAQTTGDAGLALLSMAEKIEHPKFKELARNLEISIRYCADFTALVNSSRKNMREYLRSVEVRKSMLREGMLNMLLLFALSVFVMFTVDRLIATSIWQILWHTLPGKAGLSVLILIFLLFLGKMNGIHN